MVIEEVECRCGWRDGHGGKKIPASSGGAPLSRETVFPVRIRKKRGQEKFSFMGKEYEIIELTPDSIKGKNIDIALFQAGAGTSKTFAPLFAEEGAVVIDNSSQWRMTQMFPWLCLK